MNELSGEMRRMDQRLASLRQDARQPRLTMETDVPADEKTRKRTEGAATVVQAMHGDTTSFGGDSTECRVLPCLRDDALVGNGAAVPKSCLSPLEMRTTTAAGGLLPTDMTSTTTRTTFDQPPLGFYSTKETNSKRAPVQYALYYSSF